MQHAARLDSLPGACGAAGNDSLSPSPIGQEQSRSYSRGTRAPSVLVRRSCGLGSFTDGPKATKVPPEPSGPIGPGPPAGRPQQANRRSLQSKRSRSACYFAPLMVPTTVAIEAPVVAILSEISKIGPLPAWVHHLSEHKPRLTFVISMSGRTSNPAN